jgi:hypothetical protein
VFQQAEHCLLVFFNTSGHSINPKPGRGGCLLAAVK